MFLRLLPNSEYALLAKHGSGKILVQNYNNATVNRIIGTGFSALKQILVGRKEKLIYTFDQATGILAEFLLPEIGCPLTQDKILCS